MKAALARRQPAAEPDAACPSSPRRGIDTSTKNKMRVIASQKERAQRGLPPRSLNCHSASLAIAGLGALHHDIFAGGQASTMYTLYSMQRSGNSYKVRLALARLGVPYRLVEVDILQGECRTPEFLAMNPSGQVPLLEVAPGRHLAESNAILWYVAIGSRLAPEDRIERAEALQWMFFEQHSLEPNIGAAYFWLCSSRPPVIR